MAQDLAVSPLAPAHFPDLAPVAGVEFGMTYAGIRYKPGRNDLLVALFAPGTTAAAVYTKSLTASPAVHWCRNAMKAAAGHTRALIVTAGNSMAGTGADGDRACRVIAEGLSGRLGCAPEEIQFSATGVIGEPFPAQTLLNALPAALDSAKPATEATVWEAAARTIMTTDTYPKGATQTAVIDGVTVTLSGFVKGSGMIQPNMATMLGYLFTDAKLPASVLDALLRDAVEKTFNCITVDGDTSTSDTVQMFATQASDHAPVTDASDPRLDDFKAKLFSACLELATLVVRDGEGAQKFITINVAGAQTFEDARTLGLSIGNSPLVKTAIAGADANWGRIVMAVGKAGPLIDPNRLSVAFGGTVICRDGLRVEGYDETPVVEHIRGRNVVIDVNVGVGDASATVYTCDLTHGYISINGDYRS